MRAPSAASAVCLVILVVVFGDSGASGYRILGFNTSPSRSHVIVQDALMKELARRGHQVTMISPYKESESVPNYRKITIPIESWSKDFGSKMFTNSNSKLEMFKSMPLMLKAASAAVNNTIRSPEVQRVLREKEGFDLVITGIMSDGALGLAAVLNCPTIVVCPNTAMPFVNSMVGNPSPIGIIPSMMAGLSSALTFWGRVVNIPGVFFDELFGIFWMSYQREVYSNLFPADRYPSYDEARKNVSMVFLNHHVSKGNPRPYVPAMVEVGGLQIKETPSPLPEDIRKWIEGADHGVIFFSLGTNLLSSSMPPEKLDAILSTFRKLKQRIIWKWDSQDMPNKPDNVLLRDWLPQDDILAHPNVRLFIMHGGLGGIAESLFHGVPLVGIPMFGDQPANLAKVEKEGWVYVLEFSDLTQQTLTRAIETVLNDGSYKENVQRLAQLYRDRPQTAMETAVFWTEYVIRHRGATHLRYPGVDMPIWERYALDAIAFWCAVIAALCKFVAFTCRRCCRRAKSPKLKRQ
ncbi:UDP-glucuronosyltransferase 2C1 [Anopheles darlingi]|uniref:UDP-glucuronosyltransferase n=1 Tax=Anopheles darlingi TaxID=43151 RepID=W5JPQ1_ANODA|nr:UDP-glucuronosyltransferase 2C1 [Anopheles darlingi]